MVLRVFVFAQQLKYWLSFSYEEKLAAKPTDEVAKLAQRITLAI